MYAMMHRYKDNPETFDTVAQLAASAYFPTLRQAPGFVTMYLVRESGGTHTTAVWVWESQAQADAFQSENDRWNQTLQEHGQLRESRSNGEVAVHVSPGT